ncbi:MAG: branched-chain amino acid ABC transporter permease [Deltaproteobacteria bacterium]|nr:branched-chain amino acid ABC transporter permease [Deltaproteobacteria bacterium]
MDVTSDRLAANKKTLTSRWRVFSSGVPLLGWLLGALVAVLLEQLIGTAFAQAMWLPKVPVLFGCVIMLKKPFLIPSAVTYMLLIYVLPIGVIARLSATAMNRLAAKLFETRMIVSVFVHVLLLYAILHIWTGMSDYRLLVLKLMLVAVMLTLSLNVINGYMGEFSCSHPGFMALGAYASSAFTVLFFTNDRLFGEALLPEVIGPFFFPVALFIGGVVAAVGSLAVAIPSFRTRGDYLAIISLAFMFIVKSLIENLEVVGGPRGLSQQPDWANLPVVFTTAVLCIWIINNFVRSTMGKALNAVRDNEMAADAMTVNTRKTKMLAFMFSAFWAGVAGGLFAHVLRYVNPGTFGLQKLAEVLAMVYFGGLNSVYGSIVGACGISLLGEALRPLELYKWIIIPLLLILVMIFRPTGLIAFKEFDVKKLIQPK